MTTGRRTAPLGCTPISATCRLVVVAPDSRLTGRREAGLLAEDDIVAVDGSGVDGQTVDGSSSKVRGPRGHAVTLRLVRGTGAPFELSITREIVHEPRSSRRACSRSARSATSGSPGSAPTRAADFKHAAQGAARPRA